MIHKGTGRSQLDTVLYDSTLLTQMSPDISKEQQQHCNVTIGHSNNTFGHTNVIIVHSNDTLGH